MQYYHKKFQHKFQLSYIVNGIPMHEIDEANNLRLELKSGYYLCSKDLFQELQTYVEKFSLLNFGRRYYFETNYLVE